MELQLSARDYREKWIDACHLLDLLDEREAEIERLRAALVHIECEPINAEYIARATLDYAVPRWPTSA